MAIIKTFCGCCNARNGSIFTGFYSLITSCGFVGVIMMRYIGLNIIETSTYHMIVVITTLVVFGLHTVTSFLLVIAVYKDKKAYFYPWLTSACLTILEGSGMLIWLVVMEMREKGEISPWEISILCCHMANFAFTCYCLVCVFTQLHDLVQGKGTADFYNQQEQERLRCEASSRAGVVRQCSSSEPSELSRCPSTPPPPYVDLPPPYTVIDTRNSTADDVTHSSASTTNPQEPGQYVTSVRVLNSSSTSYVSDDVSIPCTISQPIGSVSGSVAFSEPPPDYETSAIWERIQCGDIQRPNDVIISIRRPLYCSRTDCTSQTEQNS